jgi:hypothetical protein
MSKKRKDKRNKVDKLGAPVVCRPLEVTSQECGGDVTKMIKRFVKKTRKEEILKPFYQRLLYWETKSQKRRRKRLKSTYEWKREQKNLLNDDKV